MAGSLLGSALPPSGTCVLQQSLWGIGSVYNLHQLVQHHGNVWLHFGPCGDRAETGRNHAKQRCEFVVGIVSNVKCRYEQEQDSPIWIDISPIAHVALLHTDISSGFKLVPSMGIKSAEKSRACQCGERHRARLENGGKVHTNARFDVLETGLGQIPEQRKRTLTHFGHFVLFAVQTDGARSVLLKSNAVPSGGKRNGQRTCMHWYMRVRMLLQATSCSMVPPKPSARPLRRSKATIMKSLSGASYWSGCDW